MKRLCVLMLCLAASRSFSQETRPPALPVFSIPSGNNGGPIVASEAAISPAREWCERGLFQSDRAFPGFIGPISNPVLTKDPRSLTEARALFVGDWIPGENPLGPGDFQVYGLQARVALTDRLTFIADKDGYARIKTNASEETGWLNIAAGLKYALIRDVENQFLFTVGFQYEPPTGEASVFQHQGSGLLTFFFSSGKEIACDWHVLVNGGYQVPLRNDDNSSFYYAQLHVDRRICGWLYPLVELNWFHWVQGGDRVPPGVGEIDGLINLGAAGVAGNDLVTVAVGAKAIINQHIETGIAYETPLSNRKDFLDHRVLAEVIFRY